MSIYIHDKPNGHWTDCACDTCMPPNESQGVLTSNWFTCTCTDCDPGMNHLAALEAANPEEDEGDKADESDESNESLDSYDTDPCGDWKHIPPRGHIRWCICDLCAKPEPGEPGLDWWTCTCYNCDPRQIASYISENDCRPPESQDPRDWPIKVISSIKIGDQCIESRIDPILGLCVAITDINDGFTGEIIGVISLDECAAEYEKCVREAKEQKNAPKFAIPKAIDSAEDARPTLLYKDENPNDFILLESVQTATQLIEFSMSNKLYYARARKNHEMYFGGISGESRDGVEAIFRYWVQIANLE